MADSGVLDARVFADMLGLLMKALGSRLVAVLFLLLPVASIACAAAEEGGEDQDLTATCEKAKLTALTKTRTSAAAALKAGVSARDKKAAHVATDAEKASSSCFAVALEPTKMNVVDNVSYVVRDSAASYVFALGRTAQAAQSAFSAMCGASGVQCTNRPRTRGSQAPLNDTQTYVLDDKALCGEKVYVGAFHLSGKQMTTEFANGALVDNGCGKDALRVSEP